MKLPRWLVVGMLAASALAVLVAATFWWVTWPERTAREFHELIRSWKLDELAVRFPEIQSDLEGLDSDDAQDVRTSRLVFCERSAWDVILARRGFRILYLSVGPNQFSAERGSVK